MYTLVACALENTGVPVAVPAMVNVLSFLDAIVAFDKLYGDTSTPATFTPLILTVSPTKNPCAVDV